MIQLATEKQIYSFCSTCRKRMIVRYDNGDVKSMACPDLHESMLTYKTAEGLKNYAFALFAPRGTDAGRK